MNSPKEPLSPTQAMNRAATLCARSEQAPADIRDKLIKWGLSVGDAQQVLGQLIDQGFIDQQRYARAFVKDRFTFNGWGRVKIAHQLRLKGIPDHVARQALTTIDDEQYRARLLQLLRAKWRTVADREPRAAWAAMMRFAASRGFESSLAGECIKQASDIDAQDD